LRYFRIGKNKNQAGFDFSINGVPNHDNTLKLEVSSRVDQKEIKNLYQNQRIFSNDIKHIGGGDIWRVCGSINIENFTLKF